MSDLKELMNSLIKVIVGYHDIRTGVMQATDKLRSIDTFAIMKSEMLNTTLAHLITNTAKASKEARVNFLEYLAFIISTIHPCLDHEDPLHDEEITLITKLLTDFIIHIQQLHPLSHNYQYPLTYDGKTILAFGFQGGFLLSTLCLTGELMQRYCPLYYLALSSTEYPLNKIQDTITQAISEHQLLRHSLALHHQHELLQQENQALKIESTILMKKNDELSLLNASLQEHLDTLLADVEQESTQSPIPLAAPYAPFRSDSKGGLVGLLSHAQAFFHRKYSTIFQSTTSLEDIDDADADLENHPHLTR